MALSFSVPDSVLSTTLANYQKTLQDNIFKNNVLMYWLSGKGVAAGGIPVSGSDSLMKLDGGESIVVPLLYETNSTSRAYSRYDILDTTPQEGITAARYNWKQYSTSISISGKEEMQNRGQSQILNLLEAKIQQAESSISQTINADLFSTGTDSTNTVLGLQTLIATTGTVGGISRTSNSWWQSNVTSSVGSFATNGVDKMRTAYNNATKGSEKPTLGITDQTTFEYYEKTLVSNMRYTDKFIGDAGFENLLFKNMPLTFDFYCPSGTMYMLNDKYIKLAVHTDRNMATTPFVKPSNQDARVAQILFMGELVLNNAKRHAALTGITA